MATKRMIGLPTQNTQTPYNGVGSNITGGSGITKIPVPSSVSNPASLTPGVTTPKPMFSDNIAKPAGTATPPTTPVATPITTPAVNKPTPQATPQVTPQVTPTATQPGMLDINDPNNYNLTGYTVDDFLKLDPASQLKANAFGETQNLKLQDTTNKLDYTNEVNAQKDFMAGQKKTNDEITKLNNQNAEIQRQQTMRAEEKSVRDLAQNVGFLGSQGRPVQSAGMMNAYADAINESNQKLSEIKNIQDNMRTMQDLGIEFDAKAYTERIRQLNQDLKEKTGQVFQDAINAYNAEERAGMIDSPSKMLKLQQEILARADFSVAGFVQKNLDDIRVMNDNITSHIEAVKVETERAEVLRKEQAETQAEFVKNQNTVNKDMSKALGHYVNGNGQALTTIEGAIIPFAKDMPNPSYDPNTGVAVVRQPDAQGNPVPVIQQIAPMSEDYKLGLQLKQAQLGKLQQGDKATYTFDDNGDGTYTRKGNDGSVAIVNPVGSTDVGGLSGADLAKTLASGKVDGKKFFGVYATGDPDGTQFASIYNKAASQGLDAYMKSRQDRGSKITADMVNQAAIATGVDPITIAAKMAQDSGMGTQGKGARNNNPGNVGQFDSLDAKGITVKGYNTLEDGVLAVADNFKKRQDALLSVAPQKKTSTDTNKIYQILTEAGQADGVAKNNAKTLASSGKTIEQIQQEYPNKDDQYRIRDVTDSVSKAYESFNKSNTKLDSIMRILKDPNASGKSIEVALKSFVSAIDNTAAMAGEVAQARDAGLSDIDALQARLIKIGSGKVKESIRKDIENTISQFHTGIQGAYDDYLSTQQGSIKTQYGDIRANKLDLYKRAGANQSQATSKISSDRQ